jgi:four helix bundle protein
MQDYTKLKVWVKAHALTLAVYRVTKTFPTFELYGLASQMQRSSSSIPTNIVEGCGLSSNKELLKHLHYAMGSAKELEYQLLLGRDLGYLDADSFTELRRDVDEVERMLSAFITTVKRSGLK